MVKFILIKKGSALKFAAIVAVLIVAVACVALTGSAKVFGGQSTRKLPIHSVESSEKVVAITFDASWGNEKTSQILNALKEFDAVASYFVVGTWAEKYSDDLIALHESGKVEIGTLGNTYQKMTKLNQKQIELELNTSSAVIEKIIGKKPEVFRAPFGEYSDVLLDSCEKLNLYAVACDVDSLDSKELSAYDITNRILNKVQSGSIIMFQNDGKNTLEALPAVIEGLKNKGYKFKTVGEMILRDNFQIDNTGKQIRR